MTKLAETFGSRVGVVIEVGVWSAFCAQEEGTGTTLDEALDNLVRRLKQRSEEEWLFAKQRLFRSETILNAVS